jgi:hypothetical protein
MKQQSLLLLALSVSIFMALGACKEKKQQEETIITTRYVPHHIQGPIAMPEDSQTVNVTWLDRLYSVTIVRTPIDSITVADDDGQKYIDNHICLTITRQDGTVFTQKSFTKKTFSSYIAEPFTTGGILAGIRFNDVDGTALRFSVAVAMPEAADDLFVPLDMKIDNFGSINIQKDDDMGLKDYDDTDFDDFDEEGI